MKTKRKLLLVLLAAITTKITLAGHDPLSLRALAAKAVIASGKQDEAKTKIPEELSDYLDFIESINGKLGSSSTDVQQLLLEATEKNDRKLIQFCIQHGAYVNMNTHSEKWRGISAVHVATINIKVLKYLIEKCEGNINVEDFLNRCTPLHYATFNGDMPMIDYLLKNGAYFSMAHVLLDSFTQALMYPWDCAAHTGQFNACKYLLKKYRDNRIDKETPFLCLMIKGNKIFREKIVELLAEDVNLSDYNLSTPLHYAAERGQLGLVQWLIKYGADINAEDNKNQTPWMLAAQKKQKYILEFIKRYITKQHSSFRCPVCLKEKQLDDAELADYGCLKLICHHCKAIFKDQKCPICFRTLVENTGIIPLDPLLDLYMKLE